MVQVYSVNDIITLTLLYLLPQYERIPYERLTRVSADGRILVNCHLALAISSYRLLNMFAFEIRSYISIDKCMNIISIYPSRMISIRSHWLSCIQWCMSSAPAICSLQHPEDQREVQRNTKRNILPIFTHRYQQRRSRWWMTVADAAWCLQSIHIIIAKLEHFYFY